MRNMRDAILTVRLICVLALGLCAGRFILGLYTIILWLLTYLPGQYLNPAARAGERENVDRGMIWFIAVVIVLVIVAGVARHPRRLARTLLSMR